MRSSGLLILLIISGFAKLAGQGPVPDHPEQDLLTRFMEDPRYYRQVTLYADSLLMVNYYKNLVQNKKISGIPGYRIRIFSDSGIGAKEEQQRIRARFLSLYPDIDAYYHYDEPFFKVYVGDCRTRSEALKLFERVKKNFPNAILVEDYINQNH